MIFVPPATSSRAWLIATPCGVAKNTTSQALRSVSAGSENTSELILVAGPRRLWNIAATFVPASLRDVIARTSASGCEASRRRSSTPVYPVPPTMPILIMEVSFAGWSILAPAPCVL